MGTEEKLNAASSHLDSLQEATLVQLQESESAEEDEQQGEARPFPDYEVPGVFRLTLDELTQTSLGVLVGVDVTGEYPWKKIKKELFYDNIQVLGDESAFSPLTKEINAYDDEEVLIGYILDETNDQDEFYVCFTEQARQHCEETSEEFMKQQNTKLETSVVKECNPWISLGSEQEVDDNIPKKNRPLIRVEVKSIFPAAHQPKRFLARNTEDVRDGYIELTPQRTKYYNVSKKKIDAYVQANPAKKESFAQTVPRFPQNVWTQCVLDGDGEADGGGSQKRSADGETGDDEKVKPKEEPLSKKAEKERELAIAKLATFLNDKSPSVQRILQFNSKIDIYNLDYPNLVKDKSVKLGNAQNLEFEEIMVFTDFRAKNKYISATAWHQLHKDFVAVTYADSIPCVIEYPKDSTDEVRRAVYGQNPVLVWSNADSLKPKLYLGSNREIVSLAFCPYHENILLGGCINGQIILWDLEDRLDDPREMEILTENQENNRVAMNSEMGWMKIIHDKAVVRMTAASNLLFSHSAPVTEVSWLSSHYEITNKGKLNILPENEAKSMQFVSVSEDGTILIWNISSSLAASVSEKVSKESKRIPKRPANLIYETSPFKALDGVMKPIYKIIAYQPGTTKLDSLLCMSFEYPTINPIKTKKDTRVPRLYETEINRDNLDSKRLPVICTTSMYGEFLGITWDGGQSSVIGGILTENATYEARSRIHGGPINCCVQNPFFKDIVATVGGNTFAIWSNKFDDRPLIWKKSNFYLTKATWSNSVPSQIFIVGYAGNLEIWDFLERSDIPVRTQNLSGSFLTNICIQKTLNAQTMLGVGNSLGFFRMYLVPPYLTKAGEDDIALTEKFFERECEVIRLYRDWNAAWESKNQDILLKKKRENEEKFSEKEQKYKLAMQLKEEQTKQEAEAADKLKHQPVSAEMKWKRLQWECVEISIQIRKKLNKAQLLYEEKPLRDIQAQIVSKLKVLMEGMNNRQKVFEESVAILFPEVIPAPPKPATEKSSDEIKASKEKCIEEYEDISVQAEEFLSKNKFSYKYVWEDQALDGKDRRRYLDSCAAIHSKRKAKISQKLKEQRSKP